MRTPQQAMKDAIESGAVMAWCNGKPVEQRWIDSNIWLRGTADVSFTNPKAIWRPAQEPRLRPWKPEEVPVGALYKWHDNVSLILAATKTGIKFVDVSGKITENYYASALLFECSSYSTDGGKTWRPCGVMEGGE